MASRRPRDAARNDLFSNYDPRPSSASSNDNRGAHARTKTTPYGQVGSPYGAGGFATNNTLSATPPPGAGFASAYADRGFGAATMDEVESQNDAQVSEMTKKVRMLKDITIAIGDEIRDSTAFAEKMNDGFDATRNRLRGTMNRMLRMAERTGIGWRVWLAFFGLVFLLFVYVWLA